MKKKTHIREPEFACVEVIFLNVFLRVFGRMHTKLKQRRLREYAE